MGDRASVLWGVSLCVCMYKLTEISASRSEGEKSSINPGKLHERSYCSEVGYRSQLRLQSSQQNVEAAGKIWVNGRPANTGQGDSGLNSGPLSLTPFPLNL